jgi:hypothetical protein
MEGLELDIGSIKDNNLTPTLYCYLVSIYTEEEFPWKLSSNQINELQSDGWIKISDTIILRKKAVNLISKYVNKKRVEDWIESWRELFPQGVKSGERPVKGDKQGCLKKMSVFVKKYPDITKEEIFEVTENYIFEKKSKNYQYMTCADYFISKDSISLLASLVEHKREREKEYMKLSGESNFHTNV